MIENPNDIELRSEEIQEILGKPPSKFISWSTSVAFFAVLAMVYGSFIIEYPDTVTDDIVVTAFDPPRSMFADEFKVIEEILVEDEAAFPWRDAAGRAAGRAPAGAKDI